MIRTLVLAALLSAATLLGCKSPPTMDIPPYPGSSQASSHPNQETPAGTLYRVRRQTPDGVNTVAAFYRKELGAGRGWQEVMTVGPSFTDGNFTVEKPGQGTASGAAVDPSRTGGFVVVYENNNATFIEMWQWVPAKT